MINKIKISNFRGISREMEISFKANPKRKANKQGITKVNKKETLLVASLLGKNATGKSSFMEGIEYFKHLTSGNIYEMARRRLMRMAEQKAKTKDIDIDIKKHEILNYIIGKDFNNREKPIEFYIEFIVPKSIISLSISFHPNGEVGEIIKLNGKIFSKSKSSLESYISEIFSKNLVFKKIRLVKGPSLIDELIKVRLDWSTLLKNKFVCKEIILRWIRIADEKIVKIIWTSHNDIEGYVLNINGIEKIISSSELSSGTKKWISTTKIIMDALFVHQSFIFIDEINRSFHPALSRFIIVFFNDLKINKKRSQLFFTTHSPLVVERPFRKDAINFIDPVKGILNLGDLGMREDLSIVKNFESELLGSHPSKSDAFDLFEEFHE